MAFEAISNTLGAYTETPKAAKKVETSVNLPGSGATVVSAQDTTPVVEKAYQGSELNNGKERQASEEAVKTAISQANHRLNNGKTRCEFAYHEKSKRVSIKVIDDETSEVIREIPPEESLEMLEKMWELAGFMIDERR